LRQLAAWAASETPAEGGPSNERFSGARPVFMPSYLDLGLIGVILVSSLLAMLRGFTREVLAILSWGLAALAALYLHPLVLP
jgi:Colicin V production protein